MSNLTTYPRNHREDKPHDGQARTDSAEPAHDSAVDYRGPQIERNTGCLAVRWCFRNDEVPDRVPGSDGIRGIQEGEYKESPANASHRNRKVRCLTAHDLAMFGRMHNTADQLRSSIACAGFVSCIRLFDGPLDLLYRLASCAKVAVQIPSQTTRLMMLHLITPRDGPP